MRATRIRPVLVLQSAGSVPLNLSFRTVEPVLRAVDAVFADATRAPGVTPDTGPIEHLARRAGQSGLVEIWPVEAYETPDHADPWLGGGALGLRIPRMRVRRGHTFLQNGRYFLERARPMNGHLLAAATA